MLVRKARRIDVECVVRGYLSGSGWSEYQEKGSICGVKLTPGLKESQELFEPIFTPTSKAESGHDLPLTFEEVVEQVGEPAANAAALRSLAVYRYGRDYARERGIIIADTKFEFGWLDDEVTLIDECLTPDSSRFWPADLYQSGGSQPSFDKQFVRDYLTEIGWNREPPPPELPPDIVEKTADKYREAFHRLSGRELVRP
jgi:phosphoribosylaminoimidazole-succinocarboxamide synthase